jgi:hypothetical protein
MQPAFLRAQFQRKFFASLQLAVGARRLTGRARRVTIFNRTARSAADRLRVNGIAMKGTAKPMRRSAPRYRRSSAI